MARRSSKPSLFAAPARMADAQDEVEEFMRMPKGELPVRPRYPPRLVRKIIKGICEQLKSDGIMKDCEVGLHAAEDDDIEVGKSLRAPAQGYSGKYKDNVTGHGLKDHLVIDAGEYFIDKGAW